MLQIETCEIRRCQFVFPNLNEAPALLTLVQNLNGDMKMVQGSMFQRSLRAGVLLEPIFEAQNEKKNTSTC